MSATKHLLVEGKQDQRFITTIVDELRSQGRLVGEEPDVDVAETFISFEERPGNRDKVEEICRTSEGTEFEHKVLGLVDREFRGFDLQPPVRDRIERHNVDGRIMWTRGHSIENYFFNVTLLRSPFRDSSLMSSAFKIAWEVFEEVFDAAIRIACATSLTAHNVQKSGLVRGSIRWDMFEASPPMISIFEETWMETLRTRSNDSLAEEILELYRLWEERMARADIQTARWLCHGHIGMKVICEVFLNCLNQAVPESSNLRLSVKEDAHMQLCTAELARNLETLGNDFPYELFELLGITVRPLQQ